MKRLLRRLRPWLIPAAAVIGLSFLIGCPVRQLFGVGCPLCGMSRALLSALRLDLSAAFRFHPLWPAVIPAFAAALWLERRRPGSAKGLGLGLLFLFLAVYAWRLLQQDPVVRPEFSEGLLSRLLFD